MAGMSAWQRRSLWAVALLLMGLRVEAQPTGTAVQRAVQVTYVARLAPPPAGARRVEIWVPLATSRDGQRILQRTIRTDVPYDVTTEPVYGNDMVHAVLTAPLPEAVEVAVDYDAIIRGGSRLTQEAPPLPPEVAARYLRAERLTVIDEQVRRLAAEAVRGRATVLERARGMYEAVIRHMRYDKETPGWGRGDAARACRLGRGNCTDFHALFIAMARAEGIPARFKIGATIPDDPSAGIPGYHCWAEFYLPQQGWLPVDAATAWQRPEEAEAYFGRDDEDQFTISLGRDVQLVPPQQGEPVNIFVKPYVEVDGRPFEDVTVEFRVDRTQRQEVSHAG